MQCEGCSEQCVVCSAVCKNVQDPENDVQVQDTVLTRWAGRELVAVGGEQVVVTISRGNSYIRKRLPLGPYSRNMPRALWWP